MTFFFKVELSFLNLGLCWIPRVQVEFLSHFENFDSFFLILSFIFVHMIFFECKSLLIRRSCRIKSNTSVCQSVLTSFIILKCFASNLFLSVNQSILYSVMVEVQFASETIDLNHFLPVTWSQSFVMLNHFKFIWKSSTDNKLIFSIGIVASDLFGKYSSIVFKESNSSNQTINRLALGIVFNFTFFVKNCFSTVFYTLGEFLFVN